MRAAPNLPTSVHVKLFEDVTNQSPLRVAKQPPPAQRAMAELERQQRLQQAVLRQRTNPAVPHYAQALGTRPQTAPSGRPTLPRGPPGAKGYAAVSRPSQRVGGGHTPRTVGAYLPVTKAPNKVPIDPYALSHGAAAAQKLNPRLGEVEKEMLHRQAAAEADARAAPRTSATPCAPADQASIRPPAEQAALRPAIEPALLRRRANEPQGAAGLCGQPGYVPAREGAGQGRIRAGVARALGAHWQGSNPMRHRLQPYVTEAAARPVSIHVCSEGRTPMPRLLLCHAFSYATPSPMPRLLLCHA